MWKLPEGVRKFPFFPAFSFLPIFAVFFLPFSLSENAELFMFISVLHIIWCAPNILYSLEQRSVTKPEISDTVLTVNNGVPFYVDGKFINYLEI